MRWNAGTSPYFGIEAPLDAVITPFRCILAARLFSFNAHRQDSELIDCAGPPCPEFRAELARWLDDGGSV